MLNISEREKRYILYGDRDVLERLISAIEREILLKEKKFDEILEEKNRELNDFKQKFHTSVKKAIFVYDKEKVDDGKEVVDYIMAEMSSQEEKSAKDNCRYCYRNIDDCECSDDVNPNMGSQ